MVALTPVLVLRVWQFVRIADVMNYAPRWVLGMGIEAKMEMEIQMRRTTTTLQRKTLAHAPMVIVVTTT